MSARIVRGGSAAHDAIALAQEPRAGQDEGDRAMKLLTTVALIGALTTPPGPNPQQIDVYQ